MKNKYLKWLKWVHARFFESKGITNVFEMKNVEAGAFY